MAWPGLSLSTLVLLLLLVLSSVSTVLVPHFNCSTRNNQTKNNHCSAPEDRERRTERCGLSIVALNYHMGLTRLTIVKSEPPSTNKVATMVLSHHYDMDDIQHSLCHLDECFVKVGLHAVDRA